MSIHINKLRSLLVGVAVLAALAAAAATITHKVKKGETIYGISREYGITIDVLVKYNPSARDGLKVGDILILPDNGKAPTETEEAKAAKIEESARENRNKTYHTVAKGETLYGIAKRYGIALDELLALNPGVDSAGYKAGTVLRLTSRTAQPAQAKQPSPKTPAEQSADKEPQVKASATAAPPQPEVNNEPLAAIAPPLVDERPDTVAVIPSLFDPEPKVEKPKVQDYDSPLSVAILLPLMLNEHKESKQAGHYTDFVKGFMLAADSLSHSGRKINLHIYDTTNSLDSVKSVLNRPGVSEATVIIAPDNEDQLAVIANHARSHGNWVFNLFSIKDTSFVTNPRMVQTNIPHDEMYGKAIDNFVSRFGGYTPVFLNSSTAKKDMSEFQNALRSQLKAEGVDFIDIQYSGYLSASDLKDMSRDKQYVFIPNGASRTDFNHFVSALKTFKDEIFEPSGVHLFGYPDWVTFRGTDLDNLGVLNATIYSRFFNDETDFQNRQVANSFRHWYGQGMKEVYPSQALLGFDAGYFLIKSLRSTDGNLIKAPRQQGIQSAFEFDKASSGGGLVNIALYFVNFRSGGYVEKIVLW